MVTLIVDAGSTTTQWVKCFSSNKMQTLHTQGIHPIYQKEEDMDAILQQVGEKIGKDVSKIYFYGSGCSHKVNRDKIKKKLHIYFSYVKEVFVEHDLFAATIASFQKKKGIACILGTGSSSCLYDGEKMVDSRGKMGYLIDDYGGGVDLGKRFLSKLYSNQLSKELHLQFSQIKTLNRSFILDRLYKKPFPNQFIASLVPLLLEFKDDREIQEIISDSLHNAISFLVKTYENCKDYKVSFTGSVAYYLREDIKKICQENRICVVSIVKNPMKGLIEYHKRGI